MFFLLLLFFQQIEIIKCKGQQQQRQNLRSLSNCMNALLQTTTQEDIEIVTTRRNLVECSESSTSFLMAFFIGFACASFLFMILGFVLYNRFARTYRNQISEQKNLKHSLSEVNTEVELLTLGTRLEWSDVTLCGTDPLASGTYGEVWKGFLNDRHEVAVKIVAKENDCYEDEDSKTSSSSTMDDAEIHMLQRVRHKNLVMFFGEGFKENGDGFVVMEFMNKGDMSSLLWGRNDVSWDIRLELLADAANGMCYLHDEINSIHRDLKSANILLALDNFNNLVAKIADFGMAKVIGKGVVVGKTSDDLVLTERHFNNNNNNNTGEEKWIARNMTTEQGTPQWMAPEMIEAVYSGEDKAKYTQAVDVYSFGIVMWEVMTRHAPWKKYKRFFEVWKRVLKGERPRIRDRDAENAPRGYMELMKDCWSQNPSKRPSFVVALQTIRVIIMSSGCKSWEHLPPVK
jgi:serine/threonine protein kinase